MKLEDRARGMPCQVRLPGICNFNPETTVLAHLRMAGLCGTGIKPHALIGAWACSACHDALDRRSNKDRDGRETELSRDSLRLAHLEGMARTLAELTRRGWIKA